MVSCIFPDCVHLVSHRPSTESLFSFISAAICAVLPACYMERTFHVPSQLVVLGERRVIGWVASLWALLPSFISNPLGFPSCFRTEVCEDFLVDVSVAMFVFYRVGLPILRPTFLSRLLRHAWKEDSVPILCTLFPGPGDHAGETRDYDNVKF